MRIDIPKYNSEEDRYNGWLSICKDSDSGDYAPEMGEDNKWSISLKMREQISVDVKRAFNQYDFLTTEKIQRKRSQLEKLLIKFFSKKLDLHYYQVSPQITMIIYPLF